MFLRAFPSRFPPPILWSSLSTALVCGWSPPPILSLIFSCPSHSNGIFQGTHALVSAGGPFFPPVSTGRILHPCGLAGGLTDHLQVARGSPAPPGRDLGSSGHRELPLCRLLLSWLSIPGACAQHVRLWNMGKRATPEGSGAGQKGERWR